MNAVQIALDALKEVQQAFREIHHAWTEPNWFTNGKAAADAHARMWEYKGVDALSKAIAALEAVQVEPVAQQQPTSQDVRDALLFALWHHQGSGSQIGQPIRHALGIGQHDPLTDEQLDCARWVQSALSAPQQAAPGWQLVPLTYEQIVEAVETLAPYPKELLTVPADQICMLVRAIEAKLQLKATPKAEQS